MFCQVYAEIHYFIFLLSKSSEVSFLWHDVHHTGSSEDPHPVPPLRWEAFPMWLLRQKVDLKPRSAKFHQLDKHFKGSSSKLESSHFSLSTFVIWLNFSVVDLRTSLIYKSTPRFTMKAPCIAVQWRVAITLVRPSQRWATTSREPTRFGGFSCPPAWTASRLDHPCSRRRSQLNLNLWWFFRLEGHLNTSAISAIRSSLGVTRSRFIFARNMSWNGPRVIPASGL